MMLPCHTYSNHRLIRSSMKSLQLLIRVHGDLGTHQAYSHRLGGRNDDSIRSLIEMVYPTATHSTIQVNYNYAHFPYVNAKPNLFGSPLNITDNGKWIGVKTMQWVNPDGKSSHWEMWYNLEPFDSTGKPRHDWRLGATFEDHGPVSYAVNGVPVPLISAQEKSVCRVDGFQNVDFCLFSDREIDPTAQPSIPKPTKAKKAEMYPRIKVSRVAEADPLESVAEAAESERKYKNKLVNTYTHFLSIRVLFLHTSFAELSSFGIIISSIVC